MPMAEEAQVSLEEAIAQVVARVVTESPGDKLPSRVLPPGEDRQHRGTTGHFLLEVPLQRGSERFSQA
jgi:hypothetical protein